MILHSCQNCWFNGLQYGPLGLPVGFCTRHRVILNASEQTTCGFHFRKDLSLKRSRQVNEQHKKIYSESFIVRLADLKPANGEISSSEKDLKPLRADGVGELVSDYALLGSKIEALAQLNRMEGARAELAMLSLGRGYVSNCVSRGGNWTSGLHMYWWTKSRLSQEPDIQMEDLRSTYGLQLSRQVALTAWSVVMLRLTFLDDVGEYANSGENAMPLQIGLARLAAEKVQTFNLRLLTRWLRAEALPALDKKLSFDKYKTLSQQLHVDVADDKVQLDAQADGRASGGTEALPGR